MSIDEATLELIQECVQRKSLVYFSTNEAQIVFQTQILWVRQKTITLANSVPPEHIGKVVDSSQFYLKIPSVRFVSDKLITDGVHLQFPLEHVRLIEDNRNAKRLMFDSGERVYVEMINPLDNETMLRKVVLDMSSSGLSIRTPTQSKLYKPGQRFQKIKIIMDGRVYNEVDAHVVYQQIFLNQKGKSYCQVGFKFESAP
jgi:hypothetical protein